jgi:hypothetical protein
LETQVAIMFEKPGYEDLKQWIKKMKNGEGNREHTFCPPCST